MDLFTYLMAKKGHNTHRDLFSYLLGKNAGGSGTYTTFSGTLLNISNTLQAKIKNIALEGNTSQATTTGKQLLDTSMYSLGSINGNTGEDEASSSVYRFDKYNEVNPNTTIYLLKHLCIYFYNENKGFISSDITGNLTITTPPNTKYIRFRIFGADFATFNPNDYMVSYTQETHFEPYTGGQPSPSPDYPQLIKVVTGEQSIKIHNKNLFDKDNQVKVQVNAGGTLRYGIIVDAPNKKVSISAKSWNNSIAVKQLINGTYGNFLNINSNTIFNVTDKLIIYSTSDTAKLDLNIEDLQVEISNSPTSYGPYQSQTYPLSLGNIELARINNYKDYIFKNEVGSPYYNADLDLNGWYLHKEIGKITLSNSDSFTLDSYSLRFTKVLDTIYEQRGYSNRYIYGGTYQATGKFEILSNSRLAFNYPDSNIDTVAELQTYLTTNELYMYLPLSTPTNTKITDTTLVSQLENINNNARSYKDTTIIECTSESTDNEVIGFSGEIKVTSVGLGNSLNTSLLSSNLQEETNTNDIQEEPNLNEIEEQNDEQIENEEIEEPIEEYQEL